MKSESGFFAINGAQLYVEVAGAGPPLLLVHGFSFDSRMWDDQFEPFAHHFRVIRYDLRGFGRSQLPDNEPYAHADDLRALLDQLHVERATLLGMSLGGQIAIDATLTYPERVDKLLLVDAALHGHKWSQDWRELAAQIWRQGRQGNVSLSKQLWMDHPLFAPAMQKSHSRHQLQRLINDYSGWHWAHRDPKRESDPPAAERLETIEHSTLVVIGSEDLPDFQVIAAMLEHSLPNVQAISVSGAGHMVNMERAELFNSIVLDFLGDTPK